MRRTASLSTRLAAGMLALSLVWLLLGAPLAPEDWSSLPGRMLRIFRQTPPRMTRILSLWISPSAGVLLPSAQAETRQTTLTLRIWDAEIEAIRLLPLEIYVTGVVSAEMPAGYHLEALRCQAVAARTRAIYACRSLGGNGCPSHRDCDLCTDAACCQGWLSDASCHARWGDAYDTWAQRIDCAVRTTAGQLLTWNGLPIEVLYHACSGGRTEDAAAVFSASLPYLVSVASPGEEDYTGYAADTSMTRAEAADLLHAAFPTAGINAADLPAQLKVLSSTDSGRIATMLVGLQTVTGAAFRQALSLRSTLCTWDADDSTITFHTKGYGHGVGMSQAGAQAMAAAGERAASILAHYYPGAVLALLPDLHDTPASGAN